MTLYPIGLKENVFVSKECAQVCNVNTLKDINNIVNRFTLGSQQMSFHVPFGAEYDTLEQFVNSNNLHNLRDEMMKFVLCRTGKFPRFTEYGEWSQEYVKPGIKGTFQVIRRPDVDRESKLTAYRELGRYSSSEDRGMVTGIRLVATIL